MAKPKTKEYTRRAIDRYNATKDKVMVTLDKGTKERIETLTGRKCSAVARELIENEIKRLEHES